MVNDTIYNPYMAYMDPMGNQLSLIHSESRKKMRAKFNLASMVPNLVPDSLKEFRLPL